MRLKNELSANRLMPKNVSRDRSALAIATLLVFSAGITWIVRAHIQSKNCDGEYNTDLRYTTGFNDDQEKTI